MKKNGFTLIELLGVIILLSLLAVIVTVSVNGVLNDSESKLTEIQIEKIEEAAKNYYISEGMDSSDFEQDNFSHCVNVNYLIENGYIDDNEIENFETGEDMLGSVRISYNSKKYTYTYKEASCKVCSLVDDTGTTGISPGDKYQCKVKDNMEKDFKDGYYFYVLSTEADGTVNLIMDRNINSDGTPVTKAILESDKNSNGGIYNLVAWVSQKDYNDDVNYGEGGNNNKGPLTAMNFLQEATKTWTNTNKILIDSFESYDFENNIYYKNQMKSYNVYARMPYYNEVNLDTSTNKMWLIDYLSGEYDEEEGLVGRENEIDGIVGYWTLYSPVDDTSFALAVYYAGGLGNFGVYSNDVIGVRPVITLPENGLKDGNW